MQRKFWWTAFSAFAFVSVGFWGISTYWDRVSELEQAETELFVAARLLAEHADRAFEAGDAVIKGIVSAARDEDIRDPAAAQEIHRTMRKLVDGSLQISASWVLDEKGNNVLDSHSHPPTAVGNFAFREFFKIHAAGEKGVVVGPSELGAVTQRPRFTLTRPILKHDGTFAGVAAAGIYSDYFAQVYDMVGLPSGTRLTLRSDTNDVLAHWPETAENEPQDLSDMLVFTVGLSDFRAQVRVKRPYADIFSDWRFRAWTSAAVTLAIIAGFGVLTFFGLRSANAERVARANLVSANRHLEERVTERTAELAKSEARLSVILAHLPVGVGVVDANGRLLLRNEELDRFVEQGCAGDRTRRDLLPDILVQHQPDPDPPEGQLQYQSGGVSAGMLGAKAVDVREVRYRPPSGDDVWMQVRTVPLDDPASDPQDAIVVVVDVTEMKRSQQRLTLLLHELNHRVKNTLATVQAIVSQTMRGADARREVRDAVNARLLALSKAHDLLTKESWAGAFLPNLVDEALAPFHGESEPSRFKVSGPKVWLSPRATLALGMALHELATNAVKYGALSNTTGTVSVTWDSIDARLALRWEERGGPPVSRPARKGFGSRLIENGVAEELGGRSQVHYRGGGLVWEIELPLGDGHMGSDFDIAEAVPEREVERAAE